MRITIKGTNLELTDSIKQYIYDKIGGLEKFSALGGAEAADDAAMANVNVGILTRHHKSGKIYRAEVNLTIPKSFIRAEAESEDIYQAIDEVRTRLEREIDGHKKEGISRKHRAALIWKKVKSISPLAWLKNEFSRGKR